MADANQIASLLKKGGSKKPPSSEGKIVNTPDNALKEHELDDDYHKSVKGKGEHWGYHLLVDISDCNKRIDDENSVEDFLRDLVEEIKMKPIGDPIIVKVDSAKEGRGITGVQIIESSTITFHGDDDHWSAYIDVFSCEVFDPKVAIALIDKYFEPKKMGKFWLYRDAGRWPEK